MTDNRRKCGNEYAKGLRAFFIEYCIAQDGHSDELCGCYYAESHLRQCAVMFQAFNDGLPEILRERSELVWKRSGLDDFKADKS